MGLLLLDERSQNQIVHQLENRRIDADGDGERKHGDGGKTGRLEQLTASVFEILEHRSESEGESERDGGE